MKKQIKKYLEENNLVYPKYNNNVSRKKYWEKRNKNWCEYLFDEFEKSKLKIFNLSFSEFIRYYFYGVETYKCGTTPFIFKDSNVKDFCKKFKGKSPRPQQIIYKFWFGKLQEHITENNLLISEKFKECVYIINQNITNNPQCYCGKNVKWNEDKYHTFCSQKCQIQHNNSLKAPLLSSKSDDEIRKIINKIPVDSRNLSNKNIANVYLNIYNFSKHFKNDLSDRERIYIFQNNIKEDEILCLCNRNKKFNSQIKGYFKTCTRKKCVSAVRSDQISYDVINDFVFKNGTNINEGYIYVVKLIDNNYKIGISKNVNTRVNSYRQYFPNSKLIYSVYISNNLHKLEKSLHNMFSNNNVVIKEFPGKSEVFELSNTELLKVKGVIYEY